MFSIEAVLAHLSNDMGADLVSIILTTLNSERFIARSIESCLQQTHVNLELLIVDGGSDDRTLHIVNEYRDPRIHLFHQINNNGKLPGAINLGMAQARGNFITWTQGDSWYESDAIETMLSFLTENPDVALVYADYWDVDEEGNRLRYQQVHPPEDILIDDVVRQCFLFRCQVYAVVGPQATEYFPVHEVPWRVRVASRFNIQPLHTALQYYTLHKGSLTSQIGNWQLQRLMVEVLFSEGHLTKSIRQERLAQVDIDQAYDELVLRGRYSAFWKFALLGIYRNWRHLFNRGLGKLMVKAVLPGRGKFREMLLSKWMNDDAIRQRDLVGRSRIDSQGVRLDGDH